MFVRPDFSLYCVLNRFYAKDLNHLVHKAERAALGGVTCFQVRDPCPHYSSKLLDKLKKKLKVPIIMNDFVHLAQDAHIGKENVTYCKAREILGPKAIIGLTVYDLEDVKKAQEFEDLSYLAFTIFRSKQTYPESTPLGLEMLEKVRKVSQQPVVMIGGINLRNLPAICKMLNPKDGIAMAGAILGVEDPYVSAKRASEIISEYKRHG